MISNDFVSNVITEHTSSAGQLSTPASTTGPAYIEAQTTISAAKHATEPQSDTSGRTGQVGSVDPSPEAVTRRTAQNDGRTAEATTRPTVTATDDPSNATIGDNELYLFREYERTPKQFGRP